MKLLATASLCVFMTSALAQLTFPPNETAYYQLKTCLKANQTGKERFDNLWVYSYHTGAGLGDATLAPERPPTTEYAYLTLTNQTSSTGQQYFEQIFNLGNNFPWSMIMEPNTVAYTAWQPVRINAGAPSANSSSVPVGETGFFLDSNGLEWENAPGATNGEFGGWLVCEWWHSGVPQLFFRIGGYNATAPCSCADVYLVPEYI